MVVDASGVGGEAWNCDGQANGKHFIQFVCPSPWLLDGRIVADDAGALAGPGRPGGARCPVPGARNFSTSNVARSICDVKKWYGVVSFLSKAMIMNDGCLTILSIIFFIFIINTPLSECFLQTVPNVSLFATGRENLSCVFGERHRSTTDNDNDATDNDSCHQFDLLGDKTTNALSTSRRLMLQTMAMAVIPPGTAGAALATPGPDDATYSALGDATSVPAASAAITDRIIVPLEYQPDLSAYVIHYYLFGERFTAIVDSGSPFLTVPSTCKQWGCYRPEKTLESGYSNTIEGFDNSEGPVVWRKAEFAFDGNIAFPETLTFGVLGQDLLDGPGGVFFGLVKETDSWIRPSFLGQTGYNSFKVDLRHRSPQLVLSKQSMITDDDYVPLVRDLHLRYKDPVVHYTATPTRFVVNGLELKLDPKTPTYVIFDTGLTGMAVSEKLFEGRNLQARKNREKSLWGQVNVAFETHAGNVIELSAAKPITTPLLGKDSPWTRVKGNLIVLGLAFLDGTAMTIDINDGKLQFTK